MGKLLYKGEDLDYLRHGAKYSIDPWDKMGYDKIPDPVMDSYMYAKEIQENWDSSVTSLEGRFSEDQNLVYMPYVDMSNVVNMSYCFSFASALKQLPENLNTGKVENMDNCFSGTNLKTIPALDFGKVENMDNCFDYCYNLEYLPALNTENVTSMAHCFNSCTNLQYLPALNTENVTSMTHCFNNCTSLRRIEGLSFKSMGTIYYEELVDPTVPVRYLLIKDIGTYEYCKSLYIGFEYWGIPDPSHPDTSDARQSLVDSLLTYSFDRRSAGYDDCTIYLLTLNQLTEEEKTAIQAKGYILEVGIR